MKFEMQKPFRLHRYFLGVDVKDHWYFPQLNQWVHNDMVDIILTIKNVNHYSSSARCSTLRAFKRMLRKHPHIKGKAVLRNRYANYDVKA